MEEKLEDFVTKCRCCLGHLGATGFEIDSAIEEQFQQFTQRNLMSSKLFSQSICFQCNKKFIEFSDTRKMFIENHEKLSRLFFGQCEIKTESEFNESSIELKTEPPGIYYSSENGESDEELKLEDFIKPELMHYVTDNSILKRSKRKTAEEITLEDSPQAIEKPVKHTRKQKIVPKNEIEWKAPPNKERNVKRDWKVDLPEDLYCNDCHKSYNTQYALREHLERVHLKVKNFSCELCEYRAYKETEVLLHKTNIHGFPYPFNKEGFFCEVCGKSFKTPKHLNTHRDIKHLKVKRFQCDQCPLKTYGKKAMENHVFTHIPKEFRDPALTCDECGRILSNVNSVKQHKDFVHRRVRNYKCDYENCSKSYCSVTLLKRHIASYHKNLKEFVCKICNKQFTLQYGLNLHMKSQHPDGPRETFTCEVCGQTYNSYSGLTEHSKKHGEAKFSCEFCDKKFYHKQYLLNHQSHHKTLDYKCEYCPRSYRIESLLKEHYSRTHFKEKRTYRCEICNGTYTRRTTLRDHVLRQHPNLDASYKTELLERISRMIPEEHNNVHQ